MTRSYQIGIVGAGSTGCGMALSLINQGIDPENILLIDERAGTYLRSGSLNPHSLRRYLAQLKIVSR